MRSLAILAAALVLGLAGPAAADAGFALDPNSMVLPPVSHAGLSIFPVVATQIADPREYIVLDEGMRNGKLRVIEKDGGEVNQLTIQNRSDRPAFLMAGEVVLGGKQDRIIGKNMVIEANSRAVIPVFCVEHGRWAGRKADFASGNTLAHKELREKASFGDQGQVWAEVAHKNQQRQVTNGTDTYRRIATDAKVERSLAGFRRAFRPLDATLSQQASPVGYVVALDGEVVAVEVFGSPGLFRKLEPKLRRSYFVEAVDAAKGGAAVPAPSPDSVKAFVGKAAAKPKTVVVDQPAAETTQFDDGDLKGSTVKRKSGGTVYQGIYK